MNSTAGDPRRRSAVLGAIFVAALGVRLLAIATATGNPSFDTPITDAGTYDAVARHLWRTGAAEPRLFWQPFLYPLQLTLVYAATDGSVLAAKIFQALVGAFTCCLVYVVGLRRLGHGGGLVAAGITVLYGPLILFEGELLAAGAAACWGVILVLLFSEVEQRRTPSWTAALGAAGALATLTRPTFLPFLVAGFVWLAVVFGRGADRRRAAVLLVLAVAVFTAVALPFAVWNGRTTGVTSIAPASGGLNVHLGNNADPCATLSIRPGVEWEDYVQLPARNGFTGPDAQDRYFYGLAADYVRTEPAAFAAGIGSKILRFVGSRELPRNIDVYLWGGWSPVLGLLTWKAGAFGFPFGLVFPLAVVGLVHRGRRLGTPIILYLVFYAAAVVAVFVTARYRVPVAPVLALAAAAGVQALGEAWRNRDTARLGLVAVLVAVAVALGTIPGPFCEEQQDMKADFWFCLGTAQFSDGRLGDATDSFRRSLRVDPQQAQSHYNLGVIAGARPDAPTAVRHYREAIRLRPRFPRALNNLAALLVRTGNPVDAEKLLREALRQDPQFHMARRNLAGLLVETGRPSEALPLVAELEDRDPGHPGDLLLRGKILLGAGDPAAAAAVLRRALGAGAEPIETRLNLGAAELARGAPAVALQEFAQVIEVNPGLAWARTMAGLALMELDRPAAARDRFQEALTREPRDLRARYGLAQALVELGDEAGAAAELERVLEQRPDHTPARELWQELRGRR